MGFEELMHDQEDERLSGGHTRCARLSALSATARKALSTAGSEGIPRFDGSLFIGTSSFTSNKALLKKV